MQVASRHDGVGDPRPQNVPGRRADVGGAGLLVRGWAAAAVRIVRPTRRAAAPAARVQPYQSVYLLHSLYSLLLFLQTDLCSILGTEAQDPHPPAIDRDYAASRMV